MNDWLLGPVRILLGVSLACALVVACAGPWSVDVIRLKRMSPVAGHAFLAHLPHHSWSSDAHPSSARVYEDDASLKWGNAVHADIVKQGHGRFSFWHDVVYFSTSDNTDPRSNGRRYVAKGPRQLPLSARCGPPIVASACALLLWTTAALRKRRVLALREALVLALGPRLSVLAVDPTVRRRWSAIAVCAAALVVSGVLLAARMDLIAPIRLSEGGRKDVGLIEGVLAHASLGVALAAVQLVVGAGMVLLAVRRRVASVGELVVSGLPLGLLLGACAALVALVLPGGSGWALVLLLCAALPLLTWRPERRDLLAWGRLLLVALPSSVAFGVLLGVLWHGPTSTLAASVMGDQVFYATNLKAYTLGLWPIRYLGIAGEHQTYFALMPSLVGATLSGTPGFDPFLFFATSIPVASSLLGALALAGVRRTRSTAGATPPASVLAGVACALLLAAASQFPAWLVSSPPVALIPPLAFAAYAFSRGDRALAKLAVPASVAGTLLTKLTAAPPLIVLGLLGLAGRLRSRRRLLAALTLGALIGAGALELLVAFGPRFASIARLGPNSWRLGSGFSPWMLRDAGLLVVCFAALTAGSLRVGVAIASGAALAWLSPFVFEASAMAGILLSACVVADQPRRRAGAWLALGGGALLCWGTLGLDPAGRLPAGILMLLLAIPGLFAVRELENEDLVMPVAVATCLLAVLASALLALAHGSLILNSGHRPEELTPSARDIWHAVEARTPRDALIFTDQTGTGPQLLRGWNTYCMIAGRQVFVGPVVQSRLRFEPEAQRFRLVQNEKVIRGEIGPAQLPALSGYDGWYAALSDNLPTPARFRLCYDNGTYSLYAIGGTARGGGDPACRDE